MTTKIKTVLVAMLVGGIGAVQAAETYYVDGSRETDAGDGKSELTAKRYIQSAVSLCGDGDTVVILPGVYDSGDTMPSDAAGSLPTRVKITKKITLTSRDGRDSVFICGKWSDETAYGAGSDAVRAIMVTAGGAGSLIERVTVCNGATWSTDGKGAVNGYGGGIYCNDKGVYVCDCTISNCTAYCGGGLYKGTAARCWFTRNTDSGAIAAAAAYSRLSNCILSHNPCRGNYLISHNDYVINCTMIDNKGGQRTPRQVCAMLNCLAVDNSYDLFCYQGGGGSYVGAASNCVVQTANPIFDAGDNIRKGCSVYQVVSPASDDYRLLPTSDAIGYADGALLVERTSGLPEKYRYRDYLGNVIPTDGTPINCGAVQTVAATCTSGCLTLGADVAVVGHGPGLRSASRYVMSETWPAQAHVDYAGAGELLCYTNSGSTFTPHIPKVGQTAAWITLPPSAVTLTILPATATQVIYADEQNGSDAYDGTSATAEGGTVGPKKKLQDAVDAVTGDFALVKVAPGTYKEGGATGLGNLNSRVVIGLSGKYVFVRSTGSAADTFIVGEPDSASGSYGANAVRCASLNSFGVLQGFTLTGGYTTDSETADDKSAQGGGAICASAGQDCSVVDCVITNNFAYRAAACEKGFLVRTLVGENTNKAKNVGWVEEGKLSACVIKRLGVQAYIVGAHSTLYSCTISGTVGKNAAMTLSNCSYYNGLLNECGTIEHMDSYAFSGCAQWHSDLQAGSKFANNIINPMLADEAHYDFRPCELSGLAGAGNDLSGVYPYVDCDLNGNPLCFKDGKVTPGAVQTFCRAVVISTTLASGVEIENGALGTNTVADTKTLKVTATKSDSRPFVGFKVDGELLDHSITSLTLDVSYGRKTVEAYYTTDWYVDAEHGDDEADGMTPATARLTFEKAMALPFAAKDTLHAARGRYAAGRMKQPQSAHYWTGDGTVKLESRLWIDKDITVVADEGPSVTFIVGEAAPSGAADAHGLGLGALRCVVNTAYSTLKGFTLTDGRTLGAADVSGLDDDAGGAAYLSSIGGGNGALWDCVITNCAAVTGGAIVNAAAHRCRFVDVTATSGAAAGYLSFFYACALDHLRSPGTVFSFYRAFHSCTLGPDCRDFAGNPESFGNPNAATDTIRNSIILTTSFSNPNCAFDTVFIEGAGYTPSLLTNCHFVASAAAAGLDTDLAPVPGSGSPALGNGNRTLYSDSTCGTTDLNGNERLSNNGFDIGAIQSDWRGYYARRIGGRALACASVSPTACWTADGLRLGDGDFVEFSLKEPASAENPVELVTKASVTGNGVLHLELDDDARDFTSEDSPISFTRTYESGTAPHRFSYAAGTPDAGCAFVSRVKQDFGMMLIVR